MAQSFQAVSVSLGEAERTKNGKGWTSEDYEHHNDMGYNVNRDKSYLNTVIKSVNGKSEREVVNDYFMDIMLQNNKERHEKVKKWNKAHRGKINPKNNKTYHMKSVDKRDIYPVGDDANKGKREMPYDVLKSHIDVGNSRGKSDDATRYRMNVLQQYIIGFGNTEEWNQDDTHRIIKHNITNKKMKKLFEDNYVKTYLKQFEKENPSLHVVQAVVQYDETNPHLHLTVLPHMKKKTRNGLGSTGLTTCIINDHPDFKSKTDTIDKFYQLQHDELQKIIKNAQPFKNTNWSMHHKSIKNAKMTLKPAVKRTTNKSIRVSLYAKMQKDRANQLKYLADRKAKLTNEQKGLDQRQQKLDHIEVERKKEDEQLKADILDTIKTLYPENTVPKSKLKPNEEPAQIKTQQGYKQHQQQRITWLRMIMIKLIQFAEQRILKNRDELKQRATQQQKVERQNSAEKSRLNKDRQELTNNIQENTKKQQELNNKEIFLNQRKATFKKNKARLDHDQKNLNNFKNEIYDLINPVKINMKPSEIANRAIDKTTQTNEQVKSKIKQLNQDPNKKTKMQQSLEKLKNGSFKDEPHTNDSKNWEK